MPKKIFYPLVVIIVIFAGYYFGYDHGWERAVENNQEAVGEPAEKRASFLIFTNGVRRVFTAAMYHNLSADAYIEAANPAIIQVKKSGITWGRFFATLPFELSATCLVTGTGERFCNTASRSLKFYLNGERTENFLDMEIRDGDWSLISYGSEDETRLASELAQAKQILDK